MSKSSNVVDITARRKPKAQKPACTLEDWNRLYDQLASDEIDAVFVICGYDVDAAREGRLVRRNLVLQLSDELWKWLSTRALEHRCSAEEEARRILAAELKRLAETATAGHE